VKTVIDVLTLQHVRGRNRIIAIALVTILVATLGYLYGREQLREPKPQPGPAGEYVDPSGMVRTMSFPTTIIGGSYQHCDLKFYALAPYQDCTWLLQPKTTLDFYNWVRIHPGVPHATIGAVFTLFCSAAGLLAAFCGILGVYYADELVWYTTVAAGGHQCLRIRYYRVPPYVGPMTGVRIDNYGKWETWIWYIASDGLSHRVWGYPTSCQMWAPRPQCTPEGVCTQIASGVA
jgi:hypothetical protein